MGTPAMGSSYECCETQEWPITFRLYSKAIRRAYSHCRYQFKDCNSGLIPGQFQTLLLGTLPTIRLYQSSMPPSYECCETQEWPITFRLYSKAIRRAYSHCRYQFKDCNSGLIPGQFQTLLLGTLPTIRLYQSSMPPSYRHRNARSLTFTFILAIIRICQPHSLLFDRCASFGILTLGGMRIY
jgi:hypothetical protein